MRDPKETDFHGNLPSDKEVDATGHRIFAVFGGALTLAAILVLAVIALIWWLAAR